MVSSVLLVFCSVSLPRVTSSWWRIFSEIQLPAAERNMCCFRESTTGFAERIFCSFPCCFFSIEWISLLDTCVFSRGCKLVKDSVGFP